MLVVAQSLSKAYRTPRGKILALDGLDLEVPAGEFLAVCGRSGSGKSTLLAVLGGLCRPTAGTVRVEGVELGSVGTDGLAEFRARRFGFLFQFAGLLPNLRAADNVALPALLAGVGYAEAYARARDLLGRVELAERWDAYPGELSGGQQRRVALARALVNRPALLLADEPTNDLDELAEREVMDLLRELPRTQQTTLIVVTHDTRLARQADRVLTLRSGKLAGVSRPGPAETAVPPAVTTPPPPAEPESDAPAPTPAEPTPLGAGLGRFLVGFVGWVLLAACGMWGIDQVTARFQQQALEQKQQQRSRSQELALQQLRADVEDVAYQPDGSYEVRLFLENFDPAKPLYVLGPSARLFVQAERSWLEVPANAVGFDERGVREVTGRQTFRFAFRADLTRFDELIKGYMHVRVSNVMIVSARAEPTEDIFQRTDDYYIYLKPQTVSEHAVRKRNGWRDGALVPRWIAMPSH
jgi:putative ABC transport system ATP-binding protein/macrolide transport system ATP-binding/permease protein/lipoprotein-releasing system ATP-binding protein